MAIFCALCAQPGINLPEDWREYENRCVYIFRYVKAADIFFLKQEPFYVGVYDGWKLSSRAYEDEESRK